MMMMHALRQATARATRRSLGARFSRSVSNGAASADGGSDGGAAGNGGGSYHGPTYHARHPNPKQQAIIDRMLRVDHAGEYGALRIYDGQLAVLKNTPSAPVIEEMKEQERVHLETLDRMLPQRRARPTVLLPLWDVAGFALGAGTALLGEKGAMACTVAVEEVIAEHYNDQLRLLREAGWEDEVELREVIKRHRDEEDEHREIGLQHQAEQAPFYGALTAAIKVGCRSAIWIAERV